MRDPNRLHKIIDVVQKIWELQVDTRFNQLVSNLQWKYFKRTNNGIKRDIYEYSDFSHSMEFWRNHIDLWNTEDEPFYQFLCEYYKELKQQLGK